MSSTSFSFKVPMILRNTIKRLSNRQGVLGVIITDKEGFTLDTSLPKDQSETISAHIGVVISRVMDVVNKSQDVKNLKKGTLYSSGELKEISIVLETMELLIVPFTDAGLNIVILQNLANF